MRVYNERDRLKTETVSDLKSAYRLLTEPRPLEGIDKILTEFTTTNFIVEGHTDSTGSDKINNELSQKRAEAVMNYLIDNGFPAEKIKAVGYGSANPIGDNKTSKGRQANRRVEIYSNN